MDRPEISQIYEEYLQLEISGESVGRFEYAKLRNGQKWFFLKLAKEKSFENNLQREVVWSDYMNRVTAFYPKEHLIGPRIDRRIGKSGLAFDYVEAPVVAKPSEPKKWQAVIPRYARMLEIFDEVSIHWKSDDLPEEPSRSVNLYSIWREWLSDHLAEVERLVEARKAVESVGFLLKRCMQHGDLTPWQIFEAGDDWLVHDGEKSGTDLFRFTDLAYGYGRLFTTLKSESTAAQLLREFLAIHKQDTEEFWQQFMPVLIHRTIGMIGDAYRDRPQNDYLDQANKLLNLCLDQDRQTLLG